jgi:phosphopantothenoylcysteine decarboxylase/phosphopantothenate--cysteine ligase
MTNFRIGLGVCGGIAAYKAVEVLRGLQKAGCEVQVAMTRHATEFITPLTFRALTEKYVLVDDYDPANPDPIAHINFSQNVDLFIVVPATANVIAKFAHGVADDFVTSTYLASTAPVLIAPAMNTTMWEHPATQRNIETLKSDGVYFVEPDTGEMACKTVGPGRLSEPENIVQRALEILQEKKTKFARDLTGEKILITTGATREAIDPVRFISNNSSGKMGFALARAAKERGAEVTVVAGVTTVEAPKDLKVIRAVSAGEMHRAVMAELPQASVFIGAAAVADYRPSRQAENKIKKSDERMTITLDKTPDILLDVSQNRHSHHRGLLVIGFAAETNNVIDYARSKLEKKALDLVVANDVSQKGAGFDVDTNIITIIGRNGDASQPLPLMSKLDAAHKVLDAIVKLRRKANHA